MNTKDIEKSIKEEILTIPDVVRNISFNLADALIITGSYHVYRGVLSMSGDALQSVINKCLNYFLENSMWTEEDIKEYKKNLKEAIDEVG